MTDKPHPNIVSTRQVVWEKYKLQFQNHFLVFNFVNFEFCNSIFLQLKILH